MPDDEHPLPRGDMGDIDQRLPREPAGLRHRRGDRRVDADGSGPEAGGVHGRELGEPTPSGGGYVAPHLIAEAERRDVIADLPQASKVKIRFQSRFMSTTVHLLIAAASSALSSRPNSDLRS